jgi:hypothetical protein
MEPRDQASWAEVLASVFNKLLLIGGLTSFLGAFRSDPQSDCWQTLITSLCFMLVCLTGVGMTRAIERPGYLAAFVNLPISGEPIYQWMRRRFFLNYGWMILALAFTSMVALEGGNAPFSLIIRGTLSMFLITFSTIILAGHPMIIRFGVVKTWVISGSILVPGVIALFVTRKLIFPGGHLPEWLEHMLSVAVWIYPPAWVVPANLERGGVFLAIPWIAWGIREWILWPKRAAIQFDAPQDFVTSYDELDEDDGPDTEMEVGGIIRHSTAEEIETEAGGLLGNHPAGLLGPVPVPAGDRVERWAGHFPNPRDRILVDAICDQPFIRTRALVWLLKFMPVVFAVEWAFVRWVPESGQDTLLIWVWGAFLGMLIATLLPLTNALSRATAAWFMGNVSVPFVSMLPVSSKELLRVSSRIILARCLVMMLVATPLLTIQFMLMPGSPKPLAAVWIVPAFSVFWFFSRPVFIWYFLQASNHRRAGNLLVHSCSMGLAILLAVTWILTGIAGIVVGSTLFSDQTARGDLPTIALIALGCLAVSAVCARATFELHHWRLRRGRLDWISR